MAKKDNIEKYITKYRSYRRITTIALFSMIIVSLILIVLVVVYAYKYNLAIEHGAKNTVTALEMVVACQQVGNVTIDQIKQQYFETFVLNKTTWQRDQ